jgi:hypothetical protein
MPPSDGANNRRAPTSSSLPLVDVAQGRLIASVAVISHHRPPVPPPPLPSVATSRTTPPLLIVIFSSILMPSSHFTPPLFCQCTPRSPHIVRVTQITIKHCVGWCVVLTNPMDCAQTKRMRHRPWCGDDTYALGWGALMPHAMVWAKAARRHG